MSKLNWYKGNIHTHTTESDGDDTPENVVRWFRRNGYDFLVLSDHNHLTLFEYAAGRRRFKRPLMIPGEEVTVNINNGATAIHINAIGISKVIEPIDAKGIVQTLQANVNSIVNSGGIASINHPNYKWSFDHTAISKIKGATLLEIFNGVPLANVNGAPGRASYEEIWDGVLSSGTPIFGAATDDSHNYKTFRPDMSNPGRGWLMVRSTDLSQKEILESISKGEFYSSTGVTINDFEKAHNTISINIEQGIEQAMVIYTTQFIGKNGNVYKEHTGLNPRYEIQGDEGYIRAQITTSSGQKAWLQPVFLK